MNSKLPTKNADTREDAFRDIAKYFPFTEVIHLSYDDMKALADAGTDLILEASERKEDYHSIAGRIITGISSDFGNYADDLVMDMWLEIQHLKFDSRFYSYKFCGVSAGKIIADIRKDLN